MSEITVLPIEKWFGDAPDGGVQFLSAVEEGDPVDPDVEGGEPVDPDSAPMFLLDKDELWDGQQYYDRGELRNVVVGMWATAGAVDASCLDGNMHEFPDIDFESTVREANVVGYLHYGLNADMEDERFALAHEAVVRGAEPPKTGDTFLDRVTSAIAKAQVPEFYAGVDESLGEGVSDPVDVAIAEMRDRVKYLAEHGGKRGQVEAAQIHVLNTEHWYSALRIGAALGGMAAAERDAGGRLSSGLVVAPAGHLDLMRKIQVLGVDEAVIVNEQPAVNDPTVQDNARIMRFGYIPADML